MTFYVTLRPHLQTIDTFVSNIEPYGVSDQLRRPLPKQDVVDQQADGRDHRRCDLEAQGLFIVSAGYKLYTAKVHNFPLGEHLRRTRCHQ